MTTKQKRHIAAFASTSREGSPLLITRVLRSDWGGRATTSSGWQCNAVKLAHPLVSKDESERLLSLSRTFSAFSLKPVAESTMTSPSIISRPNDRHSRFLATRTAAAARMSARCSFSHQVTSVPPSSFPSFLLSFVPQSCLGSREQFVIGLCFCANARFV